MELWRAIVSPSESHGGVNYGSFFLLAYASPSVVARSPQLALGHPVPALAHWILPRALEGRRLMIALERLFTWWACDNLLIEAAAAWIN